jgi:outer membrane protein assembly factor BamB
MKRLAVIFGIFTLLLVSLSNAQQRWERTYGGTGTDWGYSVQQTTDGGYIVAGVTTSFGNSDQVYLVKTNASGDTLWTRTYGGPDFEYGYSVRQTQDAGYIVAGATYYYGVPAQVYLVKTNATGDTLWTRTYGGASDDRGYSVQQTSDGGYIVAGWTESFGNSDQVYLVKTNASGDTLWTRTYGGTNDDEGYSVQQTTDGGYIVAGYTYSFGNAAQVYLIKTNSGGDTLWTRTYGGTNVDGGYSVQQTQDGGYIVAGETYSFGNGSQVYLVKTNSGGDTLWTRTYGGTDDDCGSSVKQTTDGGYVVAGGYNYYGSDGQVYLIKTNASGDTLWTRTYGGTNDDGGGSVQQTQDGGYIVAGATTSFGNGYQVYLIKTDANGNVGTETERGQGFEGSRVQGFKITPNPFTSFATLPGHEAERFSLYDISGRLVGTYRGDRVGEGLAPGVYFLRPQDGLSSPVRVVKVR